MIQKTNSVNTQWEYLKKPGFEARPLRVGIAGAGAAGICLGIKILEAQAAGTLGPVDFSIYEREDDFGGTWNVNRYPGCRCDIPAHVYTFSFAPYADWPEFYSSAPEIKKYMHAVAHKYGVVPYIKLRHTVRGASWNEISSKWVVDVENESGVVTSEELDVYIPATGVLSQVNRPNIPGLNLFSKNAVIHTAEWPKDLDWQTLFKNERLAVVGIGSSGLQTIGAIAPYAKSVDVFARSKFWISPPFNSEPAGQRDWVLGNFQYSESERDMFRKNPKEFYKHCHALSVETMSLFDIFFRGSASQAEAKESVRQQMVKDLRGNQDLIDKLVPEWDVWCRRVTPCASFMDALHKDHVNLVNSPIKEISATGITTQDGEFKEVDRIILATGFDTSFRPRYPVEANGKSLSDYWAVRPKAYLSLAVSGFPNLFIMCGPGTVFANGSLLPGIEANAKYIIAALAKLQKQDVVSMDVTREAQDDYNSQQESVMRDLVFSGPCSSWYKGGDPNGKPDALFAGSTLQFMELLSSPRWEDWTFKTKYSNRFSFLGNGTGTIESTNGDRAYYLKLEDHVNPL